ncbi:DUF2867 domain-containing protein [Loktanella sp. D2R18]|uniref:DUF2867 domain-containing protein n=1 Tax=Rhodobacterales TaxID=204455 RepID=UPI000DEA79A1|nr:MULTISPECIES: DUF2867 domain-containing protein [Rhodobacterales]MDO6590227.1 DUF2867 domain-containing protein [Yoonia sp. 1_MG-2023]RBW42954.1 DUF2867 domain-containing protein [Loktanella sp. D2R18]
MAKITKTALPKNSQLWSKVQTDDFLDGYAVQSPLSPQEAAKAGLAMPGWAAMLMRLRNAIVKPLGLKTESGDTGDQAIFPVHLDTEDEMIIGTDDYHLNFRIAILRKDGMIHMATWVHRNNLLGRIYLAVVMPFHILIVRGAMRRIASATSA